MRRNKQQCSPRVRGLGEPHRSVRRFVPCFPAILLTISSLSNEMLCTHNSERHEELQRRKRILSGSESGSDLSDSQMCRLPTKQDKMLRR